MEGAKIGEGKIVINQALPFQLLTEWVVRFSGFTRGIMRSFFDKADPKAVWSKMANLFKNFLNPLHGHRTGVVGVIRHAK